MKRFLNNPTVNFIGMCLSILLFAFVMVSNVSCAHTEDEENNNVEYMQIKLNPYERLLSASYDRYGGINYMVELEYDPWVKIVYKRSKYETLEYMAIITEHYYTVYHDYDNIEKIDSAEASMINRVKQVNTILQSCNNKPSPEDKKKISALLSKPNPKNIHSRKRDKIYPKTVSDWEKNYINQTTPDSIN